MYSPLAGQPQAVRLSYKFIQIAVQQPLPSNMELIDTMDNRSIPTRLHSKSATVAVFGDKLSPFSATIVVSVDRAL